MSYLCVPVMVDSVQQAISIATRAAELGADYVEYRVDEFTPEHRSEIEQLVLRSPLPSIVTCRTEAEGGLSELGPMERLDVLAAAVAAGARYIDFELACVQTSEDIARRAFDLAGPSARQRTTHGPRAGERCGLILSAHDFFGRPNKLTSLVADMQTLPCDVAKVAWMARTVRDNLEAFELVRMGNKPMIALCMGEAGLMSRVLAPMAGAWLTFAALTPEGASAPGQVTLSDMLDTYRFRSIGPTTRVFGVIGSPVGHSLSPIAHNAAMAAAGIHDAVYLPLPVIPGYESLKATLEAMSNEPHLNFGGVSVTLPHKEDALRYARSVNARVDPSGHVLGTVNTLAWDGARWRASNTDGPSILDCLGADGRGRSVAVIGAGGTGRTAAAVLVGAGYSVTLYNRTYDRAATVAAELANGVEPCRLEDLTRRRHDVYVQCTTLGMHPHVEGCVLAGMDLTPDRAAIALDCVYTPTSTRFLQVFADAGCRTIGGIEMFLHQAARQFEIWHGTAPDLAEMRRVCEAELIRRQQPHHSK